MSEELEVWRVLVPVATLASFVAYIAGYFGGATAEPGAYSGTWYADSGEAVHDTLISVMVGSSYSSECTERALAGAAAWIGEECLYALLPSGGFAKLIPVLELAPELAPE